MRIVVDTNIQISALFWKGNEHRIIDLVEKGHIHLLVSKEILEELEHVLSRNHFKLRLANMNSQIEDLLEKITSMSIVVEPKEKLNIIKEDPADNRFLECAIAGKADFLISGDEHLLALKEFRGIKIIKSSEFLRILKYR